MKLVKTHKLSASMVSSANTLSAVGAFTVVEDALTELMGDLGIDGITVKRKYNSFWVFVRTRIKFTGKQLGWGEEYTVTAFLSAASIVKLFADFEATDGKGEKLFSARLELCVLDIASQKILKLSSVGFTPDMLGGQPNPEVNFGRFERIQPPVAESVRVRSTNIDHSHHTNNLEYIRFIMNSYTVAETEARDIKEMEVEYVSQSYEGDLLDIRKANFDGKDLIILEKEGKTVVRCEMVY